MGGQIQTRPLARYHEWTYANFTLKDTLMGRKQADSRLEVHTIEQLEAAERIRSLKQT